jgi:hypothetical protein
MFLRGLLFRERKVGDPQKKRRQHAWHRQQQRTGMMHSTKVL